MTDDNRSEGESRRVRIREVGPRDGFQNEPETIPTADKIRLIDALGRAGFTRTDAVIGLGGGAVTDERNRKALSGCGTVVWLRASDDTLAAHIDDASGRPLLAGKDVSAELARLAAERAPLYTEVADVIVDIDGLAPDDVVDRVVAALK